jgi:Oxygenase, catalysing oxidative methylation of damaged DNA
MERFPCGKGHYKFFRRPPPNIVQQLRESTYARLAKIANEWRTSGQAQMVHLVVTPGNNLIAVNPYVAIPGQNIHMRS